MFKCCTRPSQRTAIISLNITNRLDLTIEKVWGLSPVQNNFSCTRIPFMNFRLLRVTAVYHSNNSLQTGDCLSYRYYKFVSTSRPCVTSAVTDCRKKKGQFFFLYLWCNFSSTCVWRESLSDRHNRISAFRWIEVGGLNVVQLVMFLFQFYVSTALY